MRQTARRCDMIVPILCLVSAVFMVWVVVLKLEIDRLKNGNPRSASRKARGGGGANPDVKGMQTYKIG